MTIKNTWEYTMIKNPCKNPVQVNSQNRQLLQIKKNLKLKRKNKSCNDSFVITWGNLNALCNLFYNPKNTYAKKTKLF